MDIEEQPLRSGQSGSSHLPTNEPSTRHSLGGALRLEDQHYMDLNQENDDFSVRKAWRESGTWVRGVVTLSTTLFIVASIFLTAAAVTAHVTRPTLNFLVIGDWGRQGSVNQTAVAELMGRVSSRLHLDFVVSAGDNFYPNGLNSSDDSLFDQSFTSIYSAPGLQVPWHAVLGNHDYGDGFEYCVNDASSPCARSPKYQLGSDLSARDSRWHCERFFTEHFNDGAIELFFIDTNPFITEFQNESWAAYDGGILQQSWEAQLKELELRLHVSHAAWKIIIGHHPPRSNGHHGNNTEIMNALEPLMHRYKVQAYFSGHDHNLEHLHIKDLNLHYFVSGGGSDCDRGFDTATSSLYQYPSSGFAAVKVAGDRLDDMNTKAKQSKCGTVYVSRRLEDCVVKVPKAHAMDDDVAKKLWAKTEELVAKAVQG